MATAKKAARSPGRVAIIDGARTPFLRAGTSYNDLMAYDLGRYAVAGLMNKTGLDPNEVDELIFGTVIPDPKTNNVAREVCLGAGLPHKVRTYTVSVACISANQAITNGADLIHRGYADVVIAGGCETMSDVPIRFQKRIRQKLIASQKAKKPADYLKLIADLRPADLAPDVPGITEFSTGLSMGQNAERLAKRLGISREAQDEFATRSHQLAAKAQEAGLLDDEIVPVSPPPGFKPVTKDNGPRGDTSIEKMAKLKPAFDRSYGSVTAANASFLTDGGAAVLLMSEAKAKALGIQPKAYLKSYAYSGTDPLEELLVGPAFATPWALDRAGLKLGDLDVLEIHEAFAAQMLGVIKLLESKEFGKERLGYKGAVGKVDWDKLNTLGGSLSLGHPFGATGARLITTCANRLIREGGRYGLVAACGAGGCGNATIIERAE
jgi:acetyl-CoA acyltransferase